MSKLIVQQLVGLVLLAALAMPRLVSAGDFGIQIIDGLPTGYQEPLVAAKVRAGPSGSASMGTGDWSGVASVNKSASTSSTPAADSPYNGMATASTSANAAMGALGVAASLSASSQNALESSFRPRAEVGFTARSYEDITLLSNTLGNGSFVDVLFTLTLTSQVSEIGEPELGQGGVVASLYFNDEGAPNLFHQIQDTDFMSPTLRTVTSTVALQIGQTYQLVHDLGIFARGTASHYGFGGNPSNFASWGMDIDAAHTSHAFIDVLATNVTLSAASGHDYGLAVAAPVPEPETYAMMLAGLGLLGVMARRRKQNV